MAIEVVAGNPLVSFLNHLGPGGVPITGETFTVVHALAPDGTSFPVEVAEIGEGTYRIRAETTREWATGTYYVLVQASSGDRYDETFDVRRTETPTVVQQAILGRGSSRAEIRRAVAAELGDLVLVTATADGTESSIIDTVNLARESRHFDGMQVLCTGGDGSNVGRVATVSASSGEYRSITVVPPFPAKVLAGDTFELVNRRGMGWTIDQYHRAINVAIQRAGEEHAVVPYSEEVVERIDWREPALVIPEAFAYFSGVTVTDGTGRTRKLPPKDVRVDRFARTVAIGGASRRRFFGYTAARIEGYVRPAPLTEDTHRTTVQLEWLIVEVKAELESHDLSTGVSQGSRDRLYNLDRGGADARRIGIIGTRAPNTIRLE